MGNYTFNEIKKDIFEWSQNDMQKYMAQYDKHELSKKNDDILLIDLTFNNCLAQLTVSEPYFAPYQFVSFEAMTLDSKKAQDTGEPELVYFFYDSEEMTEEVVINELAAGIEYCSCYFPDRLKEMYINKKGFITIESGNLYHIVHPNDIEKISIESVRGEFVCKDTEAQYLVVKNNMLSLRILSSNFVTGK